MFSGQFGNVTRAHSPSFVSAKLHYTDTTNGNHQHTSSHQVVDVVQHVRSVAGEICCTTSCRLQTPSTDELTTILQLVVQQIHHQRTKIRHIPTS